MTVERKKQAGDGTLMPGQRRIGDPMLAEGQFLRQQALRRVQVFLDRHQFALQTSPQTTSTVASQDVIPFRP
jgi:hypothetical protein